MQSLIAMYQESYCKALYSRLDLCDIPDFWHRVNSEHRINFTGLHCQSPQSRERRQQPQATCPSCESSLKATKPHTGNNPAPALVEDQDAKISHLPSNNSARETKPIRSLNHPLSLVLKRSLLKPPQEVIYAFCAPSHP